MSLGRFGEFLSRLRGGAGEEERARLAAILQLNRALAQAEDRRALLTLLLDEAVALFHAERGFVVRARGDAKDGGFAVSAARSFEREDIRKPERKLSTTVLRSCLDAGEAVFADDAQVGDLSAAQSIADLKLRSVLCVPLRVGGEVRGALYLDHRFHGGAFQRSDLPWLEAFADQAAIGLHLHDLLAAQREHSRAVVADNQRLAAAVAAQEQRLSKLEDSLQRGDLEHDYPEIVGSAPALLRHLRLLDRVTPGDFPVLLVAESGCGKELAARAIHRNGPRANGPFVAINVAAIRTELLESELFGHVKGAYTGADRSRVGLLREADGGVLFLDEITETPLELQAKLLRFLEDRTVRPLGGDASAPVDLRVLAATNRDPRRAVAEGQLREDLYFRLAVVTVPVPPLRERREDLPTLVEHFLAAAAAARGGSVRRPSADLLAALERRSWPGNLRELRNVVLRLDALAESDVVGPDLLEPELAGGAAGPDDLFDLGELERRAIRGALERAQGNKAEAARLLGISRRSLYDRLQREG